MRKIASSGFIPLKQVQPVGQGAHPDIFPMILIQGENDVAADAFIIGGIRQEDFPLPALLIINIQTALPGGCKDDSTAVIQQAHHIITGQTTVGLIEMGKAVSIPVKNADAAVPGAGPQILLIIKTEREHRIAAQTLRIIRIMAVMAKRIMPTIKIIQSAAVGGDP